MLDWLLRRERTDRDPEPRLSVLSSAEEERRRIESWLARVLPEIDPNDVYRDATNGGQPWAASPS